MPINGGHKENRRIKLFYQIRQYFVVLSFNLTLNTISFEIHGF